MKRLNIDFNGPLPSATQNKYFLTINDEYSRFPFVFPCLNISSHAVTVDEVHFMDINPSYAHISYPYVRKSTVYIKELAACPTPPIAVGQDITSPLSHMNNNITINNQTPTQLDVLMTCLSVSRASDCEVQEIIFHTQHCHLGLYKTSLIYS